MFVSAYQMRWIVNFAVRPKLSLDVLVAQNAHLCRKKLAVRAQQASVERNGRQQGHMIRAKTPLRGRGFGEPR